MTWKEFKDKVESEGVKDNNDINYIDVSCDDANDIIVENNGVGWGICY